APRLHRQQAPPQATHDRRGQGPALLPADIVGPDHPAPGAARADAVDRPGADSRSAEEVVVIGATLTTVIMAAVADDGGLITAGDISDVFGAQRCIDVLSDREGYRRNWPDVNDGRVLYLLAAMTGVDGPEMRSGWLREPTAPPPVPSVPS